MRPGSKLEVHSKCNDIGRLKVKRGKLLCYAKNNRKKDGVTALKLDKVDFPEKKLVEMERDIESW